MNDLEMHDLDRDGLISTLMNGKIRISPYHVTQVGESFRISWYTSEVKQFLKEMQIKPESGTGKMLLTEQQYLILTLRFT